MCNKTLKNLFKTICLTVIFLLLSIDVEFNNINLLKIYAEDSPKTYYVSQSGGNGVDEIGSISNPYTTIQGAISNINLKPGDTIIIRGGIYHETTDIIGKNGSLDAWYTIKSYPGESVVMTGDYRVNWLGKNAPDAITFNRSSYWKVEGIKMTQYTGAGIYVTGKSNNIIMDKLTIYDLDYPEYRTIGTSGVYGEDSSYCTVSNSEIYNVGLKINKPKDHGIYIGYGAYNWTFNNNRIHDNAGAAIQMYGEPNGGSNCTIINNHLYNNHAYGLAVGSNATNNYIYNNVFYGNSSDDVYMLESATKNYFRNNLFLSYYSNYNVQLTDSSSVDNSFDDNIYYKSNGVVANRYDKTLNFNEWKSYSQEYEGQYISNESQAEALINNWIPASNKKYTSKRLSGLDRFETARKIAEEFNAGTVNNLVITSGYSFQNALSGSVLAKKMDAPILLSGSSEVENRNALEYAVSHLSKDGTIYILGNESEVNDNLVLGLKNLGFNNIKRLAGSSKYDTIKVINDEINAAEGTPVVIAGGNVFADGLSISTVAASKGYPIALSDPGSLSQSAIETIKKIKPSKVYIVGGTGAISDSIKDQVKNIANLPDDNIVRIWGQDRYETSLNIAKYFDLNSDTVTFASGENFPDALAGSVYSSKFNAPVILINDNITNQKEYIDSKAYTNQVIFGGSGVISDAIKFKLSK